MVDDTLEVATAKLGWAQDGADYSSINTWEAARDLEVFSVGIVRANNDFMKNVYPEAIELIRDFSKRGFLEDYLLIHTTGRIITWNYGNENFIDEKAFEEDSRKYDWYNTQVVDAIRRFIEANIVKPYEIDISLYADPHHPQKSNIIVPAFEKINKELINYLSRNPNAIHSLHWRKFEELLAELFQNQGFATELGPGRADGGVDLRLIQRSDIGEMLILVQAKKYAKHRKIQLEPVKALWASVEDEQANKGILVATSEFIPAAKKFAARHPYRIELVGPEKLTSWLSKIEQNA